MTILGSLTNRIFLASAALAVVSIGAAVYFVSRTTTREAEAELQRGLIEAGTLVDQQCATLVRTLTVMARLVADAPPLKAAVDTRDPPTVQPLAVKYQEQLNAALLLLIDRNGRVLAEVGDVDIAEGAIGSLPEIREALAGREASGFWPHADGVLQVMSVPIAVRTVTTDILGALTVGFRLDNNLAAQFKRATESDIAFAVDGHIRASTLPANDRAHLASLLTNGGVQTISLADGEYVALKRPLTPTAGEGATAPSVLLLRSRTERLRFLDAIHAGLGVVAMIAVLAATILSYAVARTITRPLATITNVMREMSATGDLTRKIALSRAASWDDEDAKLLASTFNTLTDSIARFQREAAQRERLSALGRLSTVIAHEIRNPLMIIKASLRTLANERVSRQDMTQALTDVDEEVARLNRVVNDVLDFARPIRFEYAESNVNALCADAEQATRGGHQDMNVTIKPDPALDNVVTDAERLRTALVNILSNARHAVAAKSASAGNSSVAQEFLSADQPPPRLRRSAEASAKAEALAKADRPAPGPDIEIETHAAPHSFRITVRDRGVGVKHEDMARVFDPYFTTKRTGSGLGLAIAKNIVEGMGGSVALDSQPGVGTEIRLDIPIHKVGLSAPPAKERALAHNSARRVGGA